jgi:hypothetical protein
MLWHGQTLADVLSIAGGQGYETYKRLGPQWIFEPATAGTRFDEDLLLVPRERVRDYACFVSGSIV